MKEWDSTSKLRVANAKLADVVKIRRVPATITIELRASHSVLELATAIITAALQSVGAKVERVLVGVGEKP